jgi:hypothetical protein
MPTGGRLEHAAGRPDATTPAGKGVELADLAGRLEPAPAALELEDALASDLEQVWRSADDQQAGVAAHGVKAQLGGGGGRHGGLNGAVAFTQVEAC